MKSAIIGLGSIGSVHLKVLRELYGEPAAVCDIDERKLSDCSGSSCFTDYITMLDEVRPNVVHICTPHFLHAQMIVECLKRDINVLCEKPMCMKQEEIDIVLQAERQSKARLGICLQNRYNAPNVYARNYLSNKNIVSATANVIWHRDEKYYRSGSWRGKWATEGGGVLINQALHTLDLVQWISGMPEYVIANIANMTLRDEIEVEDTAFAKYSGGSEFTFFATVGSNKDFDVELSFRTDNEKIKILRNSVIINDEVISFSPDDSLYGKLCYGSGHKRLIADFYKCVESGEAFAVNGTEGAKVVKLILGAYESKGEKIKI